jgi:hypothetical protein
VFAATALVKSVKEGTFDNPTCVFVTLCGFKVLAT